MEERALPPPVLASTGRLLRCKMVAHRSIYHSFTFESMYDVSTVKIAKSSFLHFLHQILMYGVNTFAASGFGGMARSANGVRRRRECGVGANEGDNGETKWEEGRKGEVRWSLVVS
jgi:hypothetical protein